MNSDSRKPNESIELLYALKRRIYFGAMAAGLLSLFITWTSKALNGTVTPYERVIFPLILVLSLGLMMLMWRVPRALIWVEFSLFALLTISMLGKFLEILQKPANALEVHHAALADLLYWFPLAYVLAFLIFESRRHLLIAVLLFFLGSVAVGLFHTVPELLLHGDSADVFLLGRFYLANAVYIILLTMGARLNEQYIRAHTLAETMTRLAHTDALIGIANRRELEVTIVREMDRAKRHSQPLSVVLFDLDHFKHINDNYGHAAGDNVLIETANLVQGILRLSDQLGRWGGEEFLVVAPQTNSAQACRLAERLRMTLALHSHKDVGIVTASFGVSEYRAGESQQAWLKRADERMFTAKQSGRNRIA